MEKNQITNIATTEEERSYFDGGYFAYIGYSLLVGFVSLITLGIAYPWMFCLFQRWKAQHTVVCGKRMYFTGTGLQLFGRILLWTLLTVITLGIYGLWMAIAVKKWITENTHYEGEADNNSYFDGGVLGMIGTNLLAGLVTVIPFVGTSWGQIIKLRWETKHTVVDFRRHIFNGTVGNLFVKYLLWGFLSVITLGIYAWFVPVKYLRWETENKIDNEHTTEKLIERSEYRTNVHTDAASFKAYKVEDDMEAVSAGISDSMDQEALLALANSGVRSAQYAYVERYGFGQYTQEPFTVLLKNAAEAGYTPAICLYLQTHEVEEDIRTQLLIKAADRGQIWAIRTRMMQLAQEALQQPESKTVLPVMKDVVRYADLLKECHEMLTEQETGLVNSCLFAIRRLQCAAPPLSKGKIAGIVVAVILGVSVLAAAVAGVVALVTGIVKYVETVVDQTVVMFDQMVTDAFKGLDEQAIAELEQMLGEMTTEEVYELLEKTLPQEALQVMEQLPSGTMERVIKQLLPVALEKAKEQAASGKLDDVVDQLPTGEMEDVIDGLPDGALSAMPSVPAGIVDIISGLLGNINVESGMVGTP